MDKVYGDLSYVAQKIWVINNYNLITTSARQSSKILSIKLHKVSVSKWQKKVRKRKSIMVMNKINK